MKKYFGVKIASQCQLDQELLLMREEIAAHVNGQEEKQKNRLV